MLPCLPGRNRVEPALEEVEGVMADAPVKRKPEVLSGRNQVEAVLEKVEDSDFPRAEEPVKRKSEALVKRKPEFVESAECLLDGAHLSTNHIDYKVYQNIGEGFLGLASILIAQYKPSGQFTVVRHIDLEVLGPEQLEDVQHEMKVSQLFCHPNITCYLSSFLVGQHLWAVQPLMHYGSCADIMHSAVPFRNGFKETVIAIILRDVVRALDYLHNMGYIHRSVRAKHFLISEGGVVKLSGLRTVVPMIDEGTRLRAVHGHFSNTVENICWLAPEVLAQDLSGYSFKSDSYSIGIAALELATGEAPFAGLPVTEIMMLKLKGHPPMMQRRPEGEQAPQFSNTFSKVVDLCVQPDPYARPSPAKLLTMSFLKLRKKSMTNPDLKMLLRPVVPLDTSQLIPNEDHTEGVQPLEEDILQMTIGEKQWLT